jgi:aerobic-type carbon monoxide dehydrogenase small subunit (CoxS/CutS family)
MPRPQSRPYRFGYERSLRPCLPPPIAPRRRGPILKSVLRINGQAYEVDAAVGRTLGETLREDLGLTGTKIACGEGHCGACTVRIDGVPMLSCITLVHTVEGREVTTIEGLRDHPLVEAFVKADALQCGFCTPGQIVSASALVEAVPEPTREEIRHAMAGNLCRCAAYPNIEEAVLAWQG